MELITLFIGIGITALATWLWQLIKQNGWRVMGWHYVLIVIWFLFTIFGAWFAISVGSDANFVAGESEMTGAVIAAGIFGGASIVFAIIIARLIQVHSKKQVN